MFTPLHFIWLFIVLVIVLTFVILNKKFKFSFDTLLNILLSTMLLSEMTKILCNMNTLENGTYLDPGSLPFHLCSVQIFLAVALKIFVKKEKTKNVILSFMVPTMIVGAIPALLIPTEGVAFNETPQIYEYFIYHAVIMAFGICIIQNKEVVFDGKALVRNLIFLSSLALVALWINSILQIYETNFFYLAKPPMDNLPLLNTNNGWGVYFITIILLGATLLSIFHLPFIIINNKRRKEEK